MMEVYNRFSSHEEFKYHCDQCEFLKHLKTGHEVVTLFCDYCEFKTERKGVLRKHIRTHHQDLMQNVEVERREDMYICNQCEKKQQHKEV